MIKHMEHTHKINRMNEQKMVPWQIRDNWVGHPSSNRRDRKPRGQGRPRPRTGLSPSRRRGRRGCFCSRFRENTIRKDKLGVSEVRLEGYMHIGLAGEGLITFFCHITKAGKLSSNINRHSKPPVFGRAVCLGRDAVMNRLRGNNMRIKSAVTQSHGCTQGFTKTSLVAEEQWQVRNLDLEGDSSRVRSWR